jgi:ABC-2 type transport system permease protein
VATLAWREIVRFFRQRNRVIGAVGQPILFWLLFGAGLQRSFRLGDAGQGPSFLEYYFPGTLVLVLLFTAIFATISIIEDRREGFLQSVLVAPIPPWTIMAGKVVGGAAIALAQGLLFLVLAVTFHARIGLVEFAQLAGLLTLAALALTALGFVLAWRMESTQGFHAIMNLFLMPMWLLSGAFFPVPDAGESSSWPQLAMHWLMRLNPLTYCVAGVRRLLGTSELPAGFYLPQAATCWLVTLAFALVTLAAASRMARGRTTGDLQ